MFRIPVFSPSIKFQGIVPPGSSGIDYTFNRGPDFGPLPEDPVCQRNALIARGQMLGLRVGSLFSSYIEKLSQKNGTPLEPTETPEYQLEHMAPANPKDKQEFVWKVNQMAGFSKSITNVNLLSNKERQRLERFYIRLPNFGQDPDWAAMVRQLTTTTREKLEKQEFSSAKQVLDSIAAEYHEFYEIYPTKRKWFSLIQKPTDSDRDNNYYGAERAEEFAETPIDPTGRYGSYIPKVLSYLGKDFADPYGRFSNGERLSSEDAARLLIGITTTLEMEGQSIELTRTYFDTLRDCWVWYQPPLEQNKERLFSYLDHIYQATLQYDKTNLTLENKRTIVLNVAKMHWLLAHMMPYRRGSAAITDMFTKVVFEHYGIETPRWKEGVCPDLEAFTLSEADFVKQYSTEFFETPLLS